MTRLKKYLIGGAAALVAVLALAQTATRFAAIRVDNLTANRMVLGGGTSQLTPLAAGTTTTVLHGNAGGAPTFGAVDVTTDITGTVPLANGGGLTTATDDSVAVGNGTVLQSKAIPSCSAATSAVTYNTTTNAFGCNTISGGATQTTGTFTINWDDACTTTPTSTVNWVAVGNVVVWRFNGFSSCTSDSVNFKATGADVPAAIRPTGDILSTTRLMITNNSTADNGGCLHIFNGGGGSAGQVEVLRHGTNRDCEDTNTFTASGNKAIAPPGAGAQYTLTYPLN